MFGLFKKKAPKIEQVLNFDKIGVDMHCHVLPGIDDGAQTVEDSVVLVKAMMALGIKKIIATPHVMNDYYRNTPETINGALTVLKEELKLREIDIEVQAAAEYFFEENFIELIEKDEFLTIGDKYVLFEFSFVSQPPVYIKYLQKLRDRGYKPILAHPERYPYFTLDDMKNLRAWGVLLQINTISLTGYYGKMSKKMAEDMIDNNMVDLIGSDMHHPRHAAALKAALASPHLQKLLATHPLHNSLLL